jgi:hypothetical protein
MDYSIAMFVAKNFLLKVYYATTLKIMPNLQSMNATTVTRTSKPNQVFKNSHQLFHQTKKNFKCPDCKKSFKTKLELKSHLISQSG